MYNKVMFESAKEFFNACIRHQGTTEDDERPTVPSSVYVVFDGGSRPYLSGENSEKFGLSPEITQSDMIEAAFKAVRSKVHLT